MDWLTLLWFSFPIGCITISIYIQNKRIAFLETRLLKLAEAGGHLSNGYRLLSESQKVMADKLIEIVKVKNES